MSTRLSEKQKKEIKIDFSSGKSLDELSKKFNCSKLTITRNLKKALGDFVEIAPLDCEIDNATQKDLSSIPIANIDFPKIVFMIVDKKIELEIKFLKEFPEYQFLSQNELARKTIQIYYDPKLAKRVCNSEQRVIKVPNTDVFRIVAPILRSRGISRIVTEDKLIAL